MKFLIITHVEHIIKESQYFGYSPYVREMNIWLQYVKEVHIVAPADDKKKLTAVDLPYRHENIKFQKIKSFDAIGIWSKIKTLFKIPSLLFTIFLAMKKADHIHLRCPGNVGLLGCFVQILFPHIPKTAKYAGNWDPKSIQPLSYRIQKWILSNTFLTKNMTVLVYGEWPNESKNIKPFFTASYSENEAKEIEQKSIEQPIELLFVGTLSSGKRPEYAFKIVEKLNRLGYNSNLHVYGDGVLNKDLKQYISDHNLEKHIFMHGNVDKNVLIKAYEKSHFLLLPSKSEGWPKAVAEAQFFGCLPCCTKVSCVPTMIGEAEERGLFLQMDLGQDTNKIITIFEDETLLKQKATAALLWSRQFTLEKFSHEIELLLNR